MDKYFVEFEFECSLHAIYWFPLVFQARTKEIAQNVSRAFCVGIKRHHRLRKMRGPERLDGTLLSPQLNEYIAARFRGKAVAMTVNSYTLRTIKPDLELTFDENLELAVADVDGLLPATIAGLRQHKMRVRIVRENDLGQTDEFLVINIVNPHN